MYNTPKSMVVITVLTNCWLCESVSKTTIHIARLPAHEGSMADEYTEGSMMGDGTPESSPTVPYICAVNAR